MGLGWQAPPNRNVLGFSTFHRSVTRAIADQPLSQTDEGSNMANVHGYKEADKQIERARESGALELDLAKMDLTDVPPSIGQLGQLESLSLAGNILKSLPESIGELTQLQSLYLSTNQLSTLPDSLGQLTQLSRLDLADNQFSSFPDSLRQLTQLQSLSLSGNQLTTLPKWLGELVQLLLLDLSANRFEVVQESLCQLKRLQSLDLSLNQLTGVPESLGNLKRLESLDLSNNQLTCLPESIGKLKNLHILDASNNQLVLLPEALGLLKQLSELTLFDNHLKALPASLSGLTELNELHLGDSPGGNPLGELPLVVRDMKKLENLSVTKCELKALPEWVGEMKELSRLWLMDNYLTDLPPSLIRLKNLDRLQLHNNPLNPELAAAHLEGLDAVKRYLRAKGKARIVLNEAKLILIGEGEVGKSCLLGALRDDPWVDGRPTTHGIEIKQVQVIDPEKGTEITLNGWDFGGQSVYRPTHQLFFSAPAVYLVVWKPREGPQQGFVKEWIKLVKHREPNAKILVVATHGGPKERQPDIDRQEIWDLFGREMVLDFFLIESRPDEETGERTGIEDLRRAVARVAASLPEVGRTVPKRWGEARAALKETDAAYLSLGHILRLCRERHMDEEEARDFVRISHRLGHLIHYEHDPALRDIVVLKPDWLSKAISFVLDDKQTRATRGLVEFARLTELWNDPARPKEDRYDTRLHPLFLRLLERFDLSYKVAVLSEPEDAIGFWQRVGNVFSTGPATTENLTGLHYTSLVAQLVPDVRPDLFPGWLPQVSTGDAEQSQICRIADAKSGQSATAEGLFFQLIVRLHKYSLGRVNYAESVHWQRGLLLEDDYGARALMEHVGNDVRIIVRSPYPERFLAVLTSEVKWLVENFWAGLRCDVMVPCLNPADSIGLFEVGKLLENKKRNRKEQPCPVCNEWQNIELLLHNAPAARPSPLEELLANSTEVMRVLTEVRTQMRSQQAEVIGRFDLVDKNWKEFVSKVEAAYMALMRTMIDEAKDGPRLFSFEPVDPGFFDRPKWISEKFRVTLWCEHSRVPLPNLNGDGDKRGVYDLTMPRDWVVKAAPFLRAFASTLSMVVPIVASGTKLVLDDAAYKGIEKQLDFGQKSLDSVLKGGEKVGGYLGRDDAPDLERGEAVRAEGAVLRQLHSWLKEKDPGFGGLVRVQNKRQEFLWVHPKFEPEY
jgi:Leucine-rich repeat (LRR) protein